MNRIVSDMNWWSEDGLIREVVGIIAGLEGVGDVRLMEGSNNAMFQNFLRVATHSGSVYRFAISCVEDEEDVEAFDESFFRHFIKLAFEEAGCSCQPLRERLGELEAGLDAASRKMRLELAQTVQFAEIAELRDKIVEIDRKEHPHLDKVAGEAIPFFDAWLQEKVEAGIVEPPEFIDQSIAVSFANAWFGGWRPSTND